MVEPPFLFGPVPHALPNANQAPMTAGQFRKNFSMTMLNSTLAVTGVAARLRFTVFASRAVHCYGARDHLS